MILWCASYSRLMSQLQCAFVCVHVCLCGCVSECERVDTCSIRQDAVKSNRMDDKIGIESLPSKSWSQFGQTRGNLLVQNEQSKYYFNRNKNTIF